MTKIKALLFAAVLVAGFGAASASTAPATEVKCDETDIVCATVGPVTVYGKGTIVIPTTQIQP